jgi:TolA-binding protein
MKKQGLLLLSLMSVLGFAADSAAVDVKTYLDQLQVKLDHAAQRMNEPTAGGSSVMGLRGAKQTGGAAPLYWKGKETKAPVTPDEIKLFRAAVEQARAGQKTDAVATLKTFEITYPQSALKPDVEETLQRLQ